MTTETLTASNESEIRTLSTDEVSAIEGGICWSCYLIPLPTPILW